MSKTAEKRGGKRPGAGRKKVADSLAEPFSASLPGAMIREIDAARGERSRSDVAREAFSAWLRRA